MIACWRKRLPKTAVQWMCSVGSALSCKCGILAWLGWIFDVLWGGTLTCRPVSVAVGWVIFVLICLGTGIPKGASVRTQIHLIQRHWRFCGEVWIYLLRKTGFFALMLQMKTPGLPDLLVGFFQEFFLGSCVCEECAISFLVSRLLGCIGLAYLWVFLPFFFPCLGLDIGCPSCSCFWLDWCCVLRLF